MHNDVGRRKGVAICQCDEPASCHCEAPGILSLRGAECDEAIPPPSLRSGIAAEANPFLTIPGITIRGLFRCAMTVLRAREDKVCHRERWRSRVRVAEHAAGYVVTYGA